MKLTYPQFEQQIAKTLLPAYIVSGDEILIKNDALNALRKAAKQQGYTERLRVTPEAGFDWDELHAQLFSNSLFAEKKLIEFDFRDSAPNKSATAILQNYANNPTSDAVIVIDLAKADAKVMKTAWYTALDKIGATLPIWPITRAQLPQWIHDRAKRYKIQIAPNAANLLADFVEGNLIAAAQTLEKIYLLQPKTTVDADLIQNILADESQFTVFDFIDSLIAGNQHKTLHILEQLRDAGTEPVFILWSITRELRALAAMSKDVLNGQSGESVMQKYRVFAKRQPIVRNFIRKFSPDACLQLLAHSAELDLIIKGARAGNVWNSLQIFCLRLQTT